MGMVCSIVYIFYSVTILLKLAQNQIVLMSVLEEYVLSGFVMKVAVTTMLSNVQHSASSRSLCRQLGPSPHFSHTVFMETKTAVPDASRSGHQGRPTDTTTPSSKSC